MAMEWLIRKMSDFQNQSAMINGGGAVTYEMILSQYRKWVSFIDENQIMPGEVVSLESDYSSAVCGAILALIENGNVIVPLSASAAHKREELFHIAQVSKSIIFEAEQFMVREYSGQLQAGILREFTRTRKPGMILFTSGTSGAPKAILHDFTKFMERYKVPRETLRTLSFLLFDHIGGINTLFHTLSNGGTIISPNSRAPGEICSLIEQHRIELLPTSPSFLNLLLISKAYRHYDLSSLKIITYGTETITDYTLEQIHSQFPNVQLRQTYGLSELGILRTKSRGSGSPWLKIGGEGVETKIIDGVLKIRSKTAMIGYLNAPNPFDDDGWFDTQDQVMEDGEYLRIFGRRSEIINVGGRKVYPVEVEEVLLQMPELKDVTVKGEPNSLLGNIVTAVVNTNTPITTRELKERVRSFCNGRLEAFQVPVKLYIQEEELFSERFKKVRK